MKIQMPHMGLRGMFSLQYDKLQAHQSQDVLLPRSVGNNGQGQAFMQPSRATLPPSSYCRSKLLGHKSVLLMLSSPQMSSELSQAAKWMGHRAGSTNAKAFRKAVVYIRKGSSKGLQTNCDLPLCSHSRPRKPAVIQTIPHNPPLHSFQYPAWQCFLFFLFFLILTLSYKHGMN